MRTLLALLLCFPAVAAEQVPEPDGVCDEQFCMIKKESLRQLLEGFQKMGERQAQLEQLCGWTKP